MLNPFPSLPPGSALGERGRGRVKSTEQVLSSPLGRLVFSESHWWAFIGQQTFSHSLPFWGVHLQAFLFSRPSHNQFSNCGTFSSTTIWPNLSCSLWTVLLFTSPFRQHGELDTHLWSFSHCVFLFLIIFLLGRFYLGLSYKAVQLQLVPAYLAKPAWRAFPPAVS